LWAALDAVKNSRKEGDEINNSFCISEEFLNSLEFCTLFIEEQGISIQN
jgi:hypothetical protein